MRELEKINIRPYSNVLLTFKNLPYKVPYAIAEFVDNAVQSYIDNKKKLNSSYSSYKLKIEINIQGKNINIRDNAAGIHSSDLERALTAGQKPKKGTGLSQFGMGMKTAGIWLSDYWDVTTTALGETAVRKMVFDANKIEKSIDDINIDKLSSSPKNRGFTIVNLTKCRNITPADINTLKKFLASMYRVFIRRNELQLKYNGEILKYENPKLSMAPPVDQWDKYLEGEILKKPKSVVWKKKIDLEFNKKNEMSVYGWIGRLDEETGLTGRKKNDGIAIFRRDRLILGGSPEKEFRYRSKFTGEEGGRVEQTMVGELFISNIEATHTKDDLQWDGTKEKFESLIKEEISKDEFNLFKQCKSWQESTRNLKPHIELEDDDSTDDAPLEKSKNTLKAAVEAASKEMLKSSYPKLVEKKIHENIEKKFSRSFVQGAGKDKVQFKITVNFINTEPVNDFWYSVSYPNDRYLKSYDIIIDISLNHKFTRAYILPSGDTGQELLSQLCTWLSIAEVQTMRTGSRSEKPARVREKLNDILRILPPELNFK